MSDFSSKTYEDGLKEGQNQAWELARKIVAKSNNGGFTMTRLHNTFNTTSFETIFNNNTYESAALAINQEYDNKLRVGDEVTINNLPNAELKTGVITHIRHYDTGLDIYCVLQPNGVCDKYSKKCLTKTGRRIPISKILNPFTEDITDEL